MSCNLMNCHYLFCLNLDSRPCYDKIQGPLQDGMPASPFQFGKVDQNNMLTLRCHVECQEHGATYNPHLRITSTKDGETYRNGGANLYEVEESRLNNTCNSASRTRDYEYRITVLK